MLESHRLQALPRDLSKFARNLEKEHGGVLQVGSHKGSWFNDVCTKAPDYAEWAAGLADPGDAMKKFSEYAKKRAAADSDGEGERKTEKKKACKEHLDRGGKKCSICFDRKVESAFVPCGHATTCMRCSTLVEADGCPICRAEIAMVLKIYM